MQHYLQPFDKAKDNFGFYQNEILLRDGHLKRVSCLGPANYYKNAPINTQSCIFLRARCLNIDHGR